MEGLLKRVLLFSSLLITLLPLPAYTMASSSFMSPSTSSSKEGLPFPVMQRADDDDDRPQFVYDDEDGSLPSLIRSVRTKLNYVTPGTEEIHVRRDVTGCDSVNVEIRNGRKTTTSWYLDEHGFELIPDGISPSPDDTIDFLDTQDVMDRYYPECERLLKELLHASGDDDKSKLASGGIACARAFDHNIRISTSSFGKELKGGGGSKAQVPLGMVHGDYTKMSGPRRLHDLSQPPKANDVWKQRLQNGQSLLDPMLVQEALEGKRRFALINVWRNIDPHHSVQQFPLACANAQTVPSDGLKTLYIHYKDRVGENYFCSHQPCHEWYYFPDMTFREALLIKQWDSHGALAKILSSDDTITTSASAIDATGPSTFAIHSAFLDPTTKSDAPPRKSIEVRCAVIWDKIE
uniref:Amine oxidase n=1 Tax=Amphora coffeiformis TaxID=265554 RepID=A0A7S3PDL4_9STRA